MSRSSMSDKIKVAIKVRPLIEREGNEGLSSQWKVKGNTIFQVDEKQKGDLYTFDHVFDENARNDTIFNIIARPIVESAVGGFNGTIFAYGQTSSGKTYTMMGNKRESGIIPLSIQYIFEALSNIPDREFLLRASYIEIYNEKINDLLERGNTSLKLREGPDGNVMICDLKEEVVNTADKILKLMTRGEKIRHIGETNMNERSSRSHTIFRIIIESRIPNEGEDGVVQVSHLNLVDLAGSERVDQTGIRGERLKEGCAINRSLFMLSHVISQLSEGQDQHVNFRDSKLTRILQSSLGGNTLTAIICAVTPAAIDETSSTLGFASRATYVKNKPHVNEVLSDTALLKRYARQIAKLQDELQNAKIRKSTVEVEEMESRLQEQVKHNELLQQRIDLLKEKLIGCAADTATLEMKRALRRRTWCGRVSRKSLFPVPTLSVVDELDIQNTEDNLSKKLLFSKTIEDLTNNSFYETPLEEFELQLINSENRLSQESIEYLEQEVPSTVTCRKNKHVTFQEPSMPCTLIGDIISEPVNVAVQTDVSLTKSLLEKTINDTAAATPPDVLRHRIKYYQKEYDELREFTTLEKQIYNSGSKENLVQLESENTDLRRSLKDAENVILDMNLANAKLLGENKLLKEKLNAELENCTASRSSQLSFQDMEKSLTEKSFEIVELKKQLKHASQKVKNLENEKSDFDVILKLAEDKLKRRNQELTQSLEDAWLKLQKLELDREANSVAQSNEEILKLKHNCTKFQEELKEKDTSLIILKQKVEELSTTNAREGNLKEELEKSKNNCEKFVAELGEKDSLLETLQKKIKDLANERESDLNKINENEELQKVRNDCEKFVTELKEKDNLLVCLKQKVQKSDCELEKLKNNCSKFCGELEKNHIVIETLKQKVEENERESYLKDIKENEELGKLRSDCEKFVAELKEKNNLLVSLKQKVENSDDELKKLRNNCSKFCVELEEKYILIETLKQKVEENDLKNTKENEELEKLRSCCEKFVAELNEKDNLLEILKQKLENSDDELEKLRSNCSKFCGKLEENHILIKTLKQEVEENDLKNIKENEELEKLRSDCEKFVAGLKEKDSLLETLKQKVEDLERESDLKKINENEELEKLRSYCEKFVTELNEKDNLLESLKQKLENSDDELEKLRNNCLKFCVELEEKYILIETLKQKVEENDLKNTKENEELEKLRSCCEKFVAELNEKDNLLEILKQKLENSDDELEKLRSNCSKFCGKLEENHILIKTLKQKVEENDLKNIKENEELEKLRSDCEKFVAGLKEKDSLLETLKQKLEDLERESDLKKINENEELEKLRSSCEKFVEELNEKDNLLESLKQKLENSDDELEKLRNNCLKFCGELEENYILIKTLKQKVEENDLKNIKENEELEKLRSDCEKFVAGLKEKDSLLETLKQKVEDLERESDLKKINENEELEKLRSSCEKFVTELNEKDNLLEILKQKLENSDDELEKLRNNCLKFCGELEENYILIKTLKQKVEENDLKNIKENEELEKLRSDCEIFVAELNEKDNLLESLKQKLENSDEELEKLRNNCSKFCGELEENYILIETLKQKVEENEKENDLKNIKENEELEKLRSDCEKFVAGLKEKDNLLDSLKRKLENSDDELEKLRNNCSKFCGELEENYILIETLKLKVKVNDLKNIKENEELEKLRSDCEKFVAELKEKDSLLETLKQKIQDLANERESDLKRINENEELEKLRSCCEKFVEELNEKDNLLESLKQKLEISGNELEKSRNNCSKFSGELEENHILIETLKLKLEENEKDNDLKNIKENEELEKLRSDCEKFVTELKEKDSLLETLKQKVEDLERESDLKKINENEELEKLRSYCEKFVTELNEKDNLLESLKQKLENSDDELEKLRNNCLKFCGELEENYILIKTLKQKVEENDLKNIKENEELEKLRSDCEIFVAELNEKDNLLESLKQKLENSDKELEKLRNNCSKFCGELEENYILIETLKQKVEENEKENDLKNIKENEELEKLRSDCEKFVAGLKEKDNLLDSLKRKLENSDDELEKLRNNCSKFCGELEENYILIETLKLKVKVNDLKNIKENEELEKLRSDCEKFVAELKEKDSLLETLKQKIQDLANERESDLKRIDENEELEKLRSCCEKFVEEFNEKDNLLESLKQKLEISGNELEKLRNNCSKFSGELEENHILIETLKLKLEENEKDNDLKNIKENEELEKLRSDCEKFVTELKEKDSLLETLKQKVEDLANERESDLKKINENKELETLRSCCEKFVTELNEKDNLLDSLKQKLENSGDELEKLRNNCSKFCGELEENHILIETLKQKVEENEKENNLMNIEENEELEKLRNDCEMFVAGLKEKDSLLETLEQKVEDLEKLNCCEKYVAELKEKDNLLESLKQKLENSDEELEKLRNNCSEFCGELEENYILIETLKQKVEENEKENDLKNIKENEELEKLRSDCEKFVAGLKERDSLLETLKQKVEDLAKERESDLKKINEKEDLEKLSCCEKYVAELKEKDNLLESLKQKLENSDDELEKLRNNCSKFCGELEENYILIETLKQKVEENEKENNLKNIKENEELEKLRSCCEKFVAELKEKDNLLESLKQKLENSGDELEKLRNNCSKFIGELEENHILIKTLKQKVEENEKDNDLKNIKKNEELEKLRSDCEKFVTELKEKDSLLKTLKQKIEDLANERESDLKKINENQELEKLSCEKYVAELKEKDNLLESLKQKLENSDDELEKLRNNCPKFSGELEENHILIEALKQKVEENAKEGDLKNIIENEEFKCLKQKIENLCRPNEGENSLNYLKEFKESFELLRQDYDFICKEMIEKDKCLAELKFQIKTKEDYCEEIENMKSNNIKLKEENIALSKELEEKDNYVQMLKLQVEQLILERKAIDKVFNEAKENNKLTDLDTGVEEFGINEKLNNLQTVERNYETLKLQYDIICKELEGKDSIIENLKMKIEHLKYENGTEINCEQWKAEMVNSVSETVTNMEELGCLKEFEEGKYVNYRGAHWRGSECEVHEQHIMSYSENEEKENVKQLNEDYNAISEELMRKDKKLELLKQQIEQLTSGKECHFKVLHQFEGESNHVNKQINEDYNVITNELMEKSKELQLLRQQILQLTSEKEDNSKLLHQLERENELMKEQITVGGFECKIDCEALQDKSNERLVEKYNLFGILEFEMKQMYSETEINLKQIKDLKDYIEQLSVEMSEKLVVNARQVKLFIHQIEQLDSEKEAGLKIIKKLKEDNELINKQILLSDDDKESKNKILEELKIKYDHLKIENDVNKRELEEKDKYLYLLKRQMEQLISQRESVREDIRTTSDYNTFDFSLMNIGKQEEMLGLHVEDDDKVIEQVTELGKEDYLKSLEDVKDICEISTHKNRCHMKELKENNKQLDNLILQMDQAISEKEMYIKEIERLEYRFDHFNQDYDMMKEKLDTANGQIDIFRLQIESLESAQDLHLNCLDEMKRNYEQLKQENDSHTEALRKVNTYIEKLIKKFEELCSDCNDLLNQEIEGNCQELKMNKDNKLQFLGLLVTWLIRKKHSMKVDYDTLLQTNHEISNQLKEKEELVYKLSEEIHNLFHLNKSHSLSFVESNETCAFSESLQSTIEDFTSNMVENKQGNLGETMETLRSNNDMYTEKLQEEPIGVCVERLTQEVECLKNNTSSEQTNVSPNSIRHLNVQNVDTELFKHSEQLSPTKKSHVTESCVQVVDVQLTIDASTFWERINALENIHRGGGKEKSNETILYCKEDQTECTDVKTLSSKLFPDLLGTELISKLKAEISALREKNENRYSLLKENYDETCDMAKAKTEEVNVMKVDLSDFYRRLKEEIDKSNLLNEFLEKKSTEYDYLLCQSETQKNKLVTELEAMTELLSDKTEEIDFCRKALVQEITSLNSDWDVKLLYDCRLSELLKNLLAQIMEKENELITHSHYQLEEICTQNAENIRMYEDKARRKDTWVKELEGEIELLQADLVKAEEESKSLRLNESLKVLQDEKLKILNKLRQIETDATLNQIKMKSLISDNKIMTEKLNDVQLLVAQRDVTISQLSEELKKQNLSVQNIDEQTELNEKYEQTFKYMTDELKDLRNSNYKFMKELENKEEKIKAKNSTISHNQEKLGEMNIQLKIMEEEIINLKCKNVELAHALESKVDEISQLHEELYQKSIISKKCEQLEEEVENKRKEINAKDAIISHNHNELGEMRGHLKTLQEEIVNLTCKNAELADKLKNETVEISNKDMKISQLHEELNDISVISKKYEQLKEEVKNKREEIKAKDATIYHNYKELGEMNIKLKTLEDKFTMLEIKNVELSNALQNKIEEILQKDMKVSQLCDELKNHKSLTNKYEQLRKEYVTLKVKNTELAHTLESKINEVSQQDVRISQLQKESHYRYITNTEYEQLVKELENRSEEVMAKDATISHNHKELGEMSRQLKTLEEEIINLKCKNLELADKLKNKIDEILYRDVKIAELNEELNHKSVISKKYEELEEEVKNKREEIKAKNATICHNHEEIGQLEIMKREFTTLKIKNAELTNILENKIEVIFQKDAKILQLHEELKNHKSVMNEKYKQLKEEFSNLKVKNEELTVSQLHEELKSKQHSVATLTDVTECQCSELVKKLQQAKRTIVELNTKIGTLELQIKTEELPYQQSVKQLEANLCFYKKKNTMLKSVLRNLQHQVNEAQKVCETCVRHKSKVMKEALMQTDNIQDDGGSRYYDFGGSGIVREHTILELKLAIKEKNSDMALLKELCRKRRKKILTLEEELLKVMPTTAAGNNSIRNSQHLIDAIVQTDDFAVCSLKSRFKEDNMEMQKMIVKIGDLQKENEQLRNLNGGIRKKATEQENVHLWYPPSNLTSADQCFMLQESQRVKKLYSSGVTPGFHTSSDRHLHSSNKENIPHSYKTIETLRTLK